MKEWWQSRRDVLKRRRQGGKSKFFDFVTEVLFWVPELLFLPFRLLF